VKEGTETCDDGNTSDGDGCSSTCAVETSYTCDEASPTICKRCGDGVKEGIETCDDGNTSDGDG
jgi:large repetitive protein